MNTELVRICLLQENGSICYYDENGKEVVLNGQIGVMGHAIKTKQ